MKDEAGAGSRSQRFQWSKITGFFN